MPVPVPIYSKPSAHPVIKNHKHAARTDYARQSVFRHLTNSLPQPPAGPPPSFASREEWISSLPSWRRNKPRRIWEEDTPTADSRRRDFEEGLAAADNASVIKGAPAQAGIPPVSTLFTSADMGAPTQRRVAMHDEDADDEMSPLDEAMRWQGEDVAHLTDDDDDLTMEQSPDSGSHGYAERYQYAIQRAADVGPDPAAYTRNHERGAFSPVYEEPSPEHDSGSSPIAPSTPFGEFVDRAVGPQIVVGTQHVAPTMELQYPYVDEYCGAQCYQCQHYVPVEQPVQQPPPVPEPVVTPTASPAYKKLAEPLSEWVSDFVWKVCTTGMSLPSEYAQPAAFVRQYSQQAPGTLARSVHSMLLSTLLQPSAVFLALWYIVRLPVFFGPVNLGHAHTREMRFRAELLGDVHLPLDRDAIEAYAPFRLVLLGCMLANKWLDDHTFSNKTWHTISNVPTQSLNKLEALALELFGHDLSISTEDWTRWLKEITLYHQSLSSPAFPQPISRPSSSPHNIIRKAVDDLIESSDASEDNRVDGVPQPVFWGLEGRKISVSEEVFEDVDVLEIDLDEDGPLREEYLPRRRISNASNSRRSYERPAEVDRTLPPPARWSPAADEPILRPNNVRPPHHYVAPQPIARGQMSAMPAPPPVPYPQPLDMGHRIWSSDGQVARHPYVSSHVPIFAAPPPAYAGYDYTYPPPAPPTSHSRAHSMSFNAPVVAQPQGHFRSYSQSQFEGGHEMAFPLRYPPAPSSTAPQWPAHYTSSFYPSVYEPLYDYHSRPLVKV